MNGNGVGGEVRGARSGWKLRKGRYSLISSALLGLAVLCGAGAAKARLLPGKAIVQSGINIANLKLCTRTAPDGNCDPFTSYFINPSNPAPGIGLYNLIGDSEPEVFTLAHHNNHMSTWELSLDGTLLGTTELPNTPNAVGFGVGDFDTSSLHFFIAYMSAGVDLRVRVLNRNGQEVTTIDLPEVPDIYGFALIDGTLVTRFSFLHRNPAIGGAPLLISTYGTDGALVSELPISRDIYPVGGFTYRNDSASWYILQGVPGTNVATLWSYLYDGTQEEQLNLYDVPNDGLRGLAVLPSRLCQDDDNHHLFSGNWCDGLDNDCDDLVDEDYGSTPQAWGDGVIQCDYCATPGTCANGEITPTACAQDCKPAPAIPVGNTTDSGWQFFGFAYDFDVANDKLCYVIPLPGFGVEGQIACTQQVGSVGDLVDAPAEFFNGGGQGVSLDPLGRVWATGANASAIYAQINSPALQLVANKPAGCDRIDQIELVGPADRDFFGLTARPFIRCGNGKVFELTPSTGGFIQHAFNSSSLGASPSSSFDLFFKASANVGGQLIARADAANNVTPLALIGAGDQTALVGGVYIVGNDYSGGPPVVPGNDPGELSQWNGTAIEPVANLLAPLDAVVLGDGKYGVLSAPTLNDGDPRVTFPAHKVVEGGGVGVGGPSPPGLTDVVWVLSNTYRIYGYHLPPIPEDIRPHLLGDDAAPISALSMRPGGLNQEPVALCRPVVVEAGPECLALPDPEAFDDGSYDLDGDLIAFSVAPTSEQAPGETIVELFVSDGYSFTSCATTFTVVDATPPSIVAPPAVKTALCGASESVEIGNASAEDGCMDPIVFGTVTKRNGQALPVPIPVVNGRAQLGVGVYEVDWTASDGSNESHAKQQVTVGTKIQAAQSFILGDRARLEASAGGFAQVYNSGSETTRIGNDAKSAGILSVAPVTVQHRAIVGGAVLSAAGVTVDSDATVTGTVTRFGSVTLPALPSLPTFPAPSGGNRTLNSGVTTLAIGSYGDVIVNSGAELRLGPGDYFFRSFLVNSSSSILKANAATRVFVLNQLALRSSFKSSTNAIESIFLGFAGTNVTLEAAFNGTFLAPNAFASFGTGSALTFKGSFLARSIEARSATTLVCK